MPRAVLVWAVLLAAPLLAALFAAEESAAPTLGAAPAVVFDERIPWATPRVTGSPEPPLPYRVERVAPHLGFANPTFVVFAPDGDRVFIGEQRGRVFSFSYKSPGEKPDLALDLTTDLTSWSARDGAKRVDALYDLAFDPEFQDNRYIYLTYTLASLTSKPLPNGTRVSRFKLTDEQPPRIDPASEKIIITWVEGGHNGGCLEFGRDGYLYVSTGDAATPNPPDVLATGQDCRDLLSSILRIDVRENSPAPSRPYTVPADNPFVSEEFQKEGVRPEIWAFGFRNPWKMSFDRATGDLWVGDVGWELWELVDRVEKGGNYGWSIVEGRQPVRQDVKLGPTPVLPPTIDFSHTEAASITGGFVYRGKEFPDLVGCYVCGDWETRKMWATKWENGRIGEKRSIASDTVRITDFGEDANGELYVIDFGENAGLYKLARNETDATASEKFPRKLSETGLFANVAQHVLSSGVLPFEINVEQWCDHATSERFIGLPERSTVSILNEARPIPGSMFTAKTFFPKDGVLARTFSLEMTRGKPETARRIETQILHFNGKGWQGYSYRWNDAETDAELVDAAGADQTFKIIEQGEPRTQRWHFPSRTECMQCHNPWPGYTLAFTLPQLHRPADEKLSPSGEDQVDVFKRLGMLDSLEEPRPLTFPETFNVDSPEARGRAYLHVNCSHCHQMGAGGSVDLDLRAELALDKMKIVDRKPSQGTFGIDDAQIVSSGRPYHSVLYYRMAKLGRGRMPHIGSEFVDVRGLQIIDEWIRSLAPGQERDDAAALLKSLAKGDGKWDDLAARTPDALGLLAALDGQASDEAKAKLVAHARTLPVGPVRDLFERFFPDDERAERLGATFDKAKLLAMPGDAARGRTVFFETTGVSCKNCHKIAGQDGATSAGEVGPELSAIGKKLSREQLLESLMEPSKTVDPKFAGYSLETTDGRSFVGRLVERNGERIALRDAAGKDVVVAAEDVEAFAPLPVSLMPERLLQDLSPQQAADLLAYLHSLKGE